MHKDQESSRIREVYSGRDREGKSSLYAWYRREVRQQDAARDMQVSRFLNMAFGTDLSELSVLDVGCGSGGFLRKLVEWGANPQSLTGTEFLEDRLEAAEVISAPGITWHLGDCSFAKDAHYDLVTANTVFSSIIDDSARSELASEIWRLIKPGGWVMIFDFRYNNPGNQNVRKITLKQLDTFWPDAASRHWKTILLAPPLARRLAPISPWLAGTLEAALPPLRSHFIYFAQKQDL